MSVLYCAIFVWNIPLVFPIFLKRSLFFTILLFSSISLHCSFKKSLLSFFAFLWNSAFSWVLSCHLFLISSAPVRSLPFLSFIVSVLAWNVCSLDISSFLEELSIFFILLFSSISLHSSLNKTFLSLLAVLWNSTFSWICLYSSPLPFTYLLFSAICQASSDNHFALLHFFFLKMVMVTASCTMLRTSIHSYSDTWSDLSPWIYLSRPLYNHKGFDLGHT